MVLIENGSELKWNNWSKWFTFINDSIKKSIDLGPLEVCYLSIAGLWGFAGKWLAFIKDSIGKSIVLGLVELCCEVAHFH